VERWRRKSRHSKHDAKFSQKKKQLAEVTARLTTFRRPAQIRAGAKFAVAAGSSAARAIGQGSKTNGAVRRSWFEPGEALALVRKVSESRMAGRTCPCVGEAKELSSEAVQRRLQRFSSSPSYAAIKHAVNAKEAFQGQGRHIKTFAVAARRISEKRGFLAACGAAMLTRSEEPQTNAVSAAA